MDTILRQLFGLNSLIVIFVLLNNITGKEISPEGSDDGEQLLAHASPHQIARNQIYKGKSTDVLKGYFRHLNKQNKTDIFLFRSANKDFSSGNNKINSGNEREIVHPKYDAMVGLPKSIKESTSTTQSSHPSLDFKTTYSVSKPFGSEGQSLVVDRSQSSGHEARPAMPVGLGSSAMPVTQPNRLHYVFSTTKPNTNRFNSNYGYPYALRSISSNSGSTQNNDGHQHNINTSVESPNLNPYREIVRKILVKSLALMDEDYPDGKTHQMSSETSGQPCQNNGPGETSVGSDGDGLSGKPKFPNQGQLLKNHTQDVSFEASDINKLEYSTWTSNHEDGNARRNKSRLSTRSSKISTLLNNNRPDITRTQINNTDRIISKSRIRRVLTTAEHNAANGNVNSNNMNNINNNNNNDNNNNQDNSGSSTSSSYPSSAVAGSTPVDSNVFSRFASETISFERQSASEITRLDNLLRQLALAAQTDFSTVSASVSAMQKELLQTQQQLVQAWNLLNVTHAQDTENTLSELHEVKTDVYRLHALLTGVTPLGQSAAQGRVAEVREEARAGVDCAALAKSGVNSSGVYDLQPDPSNNQTRMTAYCDMETDSGGWTVFQRRKDGSDDFFRGWNSYKHGFGSYHHDHWLGLENIHSLTKYGDNVMRIELIDWEDETRWAEFSYTRIMDESDGYRILVGGYRGNAGDPFHSLSYDMRMQSMRFSTFDSDNDMDNGGNCALTFTSGWWFNKCFQINLNGVWYGSSRYSGPSMNGIVWDLWPDHFNGYSLKQTEMKLRPANFLKTK